MGPGARCARVVRAPVRVLESKPLAGKDKLISAVSGKPAVRNQRARRNKNNAC
jgi:hypothetical protein